MRSEISRVFPIPKMCHMNQFSNCTNLESCKQTYGFTYKVKELAEAAHAQVTIRGVACIRHSGASIQTFYTSAGNQTEKKHKRIQKEAQKDPS